MPVPGARGLVYALALRLCLLLSDAQLLSLRRTVAAACHVLETRRRLLPPGATPYPVRLPSGALFSAGARVEDEAVAPLWASVSHAHASFGPLAFVLTRPLVHLLVHGWLTPAFVTLARAVVVRGAVLSGAILREGEQAAVAAFDPDLDRLDVLVIAGAKVAYRRAEFQPEVFADVLATNLTGPMQLAMKCFYQALI